MAADDVTEYRVKHPVGTTYEIKDIREIGDHTFLGEAAGKFSGIVTDRDIDVLLCYRTGKTLRYLDVNLTLDREALNGGIDEVTYDVYIVDENKVSNDIHDYYESLPYGATYEVRDIKVSGCYQNDGPQVYTGIIIDSVVVTIPIVTNHKGGTKIRNAKEATCGKAGYTGDTYCKGCDALLASGETIPATGKHTWNDGVVTTAPTYTTPGVKTFTCTVCSVTRTEVIDPIPQPADPDAVITVATVNAQPGRTVDVTVDLTEYAPMSYLLLGLDYNKTVLTLNSVKNGGLFDTLESGANLLLNAGSDIAAGGNLLTLTFTVSEDAEPGDYTVTVTCKQCYNNSEEPLLVKVENGKITVPDVIVGDVNDDEVIDERDLIRLRKYLANLDEETGESTVEISAGADCTGDGIVDGRDLIRLRKYLANLDENTGISTVELG